MALIPCPECGKKISNLAASCRYCNMTEEEPSKPRLWLWIPVGLLASRLTLAYFVGSTPEAQERAHDRSVIQLCWSEQKRPSREPDTARFIAGACEKMESDFQQKHGQNP